MCKKGDKASKHIGKRIGRLEEVILPYSGIYRYMFYGVCLECGSTLYYPAILNNGRNSWGEESYSDSWFKAGNMYNIRNGVIQLGPIDIKNDGTIDPYGDGSK